MRWWAKVFQSHSSAFWTEWDNRMCLVHNMGRCCFIRLQAENLRSNQGATIQFQVIWCDYNFHLFQHYSCSAPDMICQQGLNNTMCHSCCRSVLSIRALTSIVWTVDFMCIHRICAGHNFDIGLIPARHLAAFPLALLLMKYISNKILQLDV